MNILEGLLILVLVGALAVAGYFLWENFPGGGTVTNLAYSPPANVSNLPLVAKQFYPRMRYQDRDISYTISASCDASRLNNILAAFAKLSQKTVLTFSPAGRGELNVLCSDVAPTAEEKTHFIAGEGGPAAIVNTSNYAVILNGKISLYRTETCDEPQIALHELLHALGFDHTSKKESIMYSVTGCDQQLDESIIDDITTLYTEQPAPDVSIVRVQANLTKAYLNFEIEIRNDGLLPAHDVQLDVLSGTKPVKTFDLEEIELGAQKSLSVQNVRVPRDTTAITFVVGAREKTELSMSNNNVTLALK